MPKRIQRKRTKGWRMPEGAIYVGRPTKWGNPYRATKGPGGLWFANHADNKNTNRLGWGPVADKEKAIKLAVNLFRGYAALQALLNKEWLDSLRAHDLACWCPLDQLCHADVLLELLAETEKGGDK